MRFSAILRTLVQFLLYALQRNFTHLGTIFILCASAQFYAKAIFVIGRLYPDRGGVEATGQTASLLAKAAPSLQHHSSIGS